MSREHERSLRALRWGESINHWLIDAVPEPTVAAPAGGAAAAAPVGGAATVPAAADAPTAAACAAAEKVLDYLPQELRQHRTAFAKRLKMYLSESHAASDQSRFWADGILAVLSGFGAFITWRMVDATFFGDATPFAGSPNLVKQCASVVTIFVFGAYAYGFHRWLESGARWGVTAPFIWAATIVLALTSGLGLVARGHFTLAALLISFSLGATGALWAGWGLLINQVIRWSYARPITRSRDPEGHALALALGLYVRASRGPDSFRVVASEWQHHLLWGLEELARSLSSGFVTGLSLDRGTARRQRELGYRRGEMVREWKDLIIEPSQEALTKLRGYLSEMLEGAFEHQWPVKQLPQVQLSAQPQDYVLAAFLLIVIGLAHWGATTLLAPSLEAAGLSPVGGYVRTWATPAAILVFVLGLPTPLITKFTQAAGQAKELRGAVAGE